MRGRAFAPLAIILHTHLPLLRGTARWPVGEEWLYQAMAESHLRVLLVLEELAQEGLGGITLAVSPVLSEQWSDPRVVHSLLYWLGVALLRAERHAAQYRGEYEEEERALGAFYHRFYSRLADEASSLLRGEGIPGRLASLAREGVVELWCEPLTHPLLPLLATGSFRRAQVLGGLLHHLRTFRQRPAGIWLPECGYLPGVEELLSDVGLEVTCLSGDGEPGELGRVKVLLESRELRGLVWSSSGYPSSPEYRDFWTADAYTGLKTRAVGRSPYHPESGLARARDHAHRFAREVARRAESAPGPLLLALDTEFLGHWWFEGPDFLLHLLRALLEEGVPVVGASEAAEGARGRPSPRASWAEDGFDPWVEKETHDFWKEAGNLEESLLRAASRQRWHSREELEEAARQIFLAQASDWAFMVTRGRAPQFGRERFLTHARLARDLLRADPERRGMALAEAASLSCGFPSSPLALLGVAGDGPSL